MTEHSEGGFRAKYRAAMVCQVSSAAGEIERQMILDNGARAP